ncbi:MAG: NADPH-dependent reductase [Eubacterium sp.]|nr:NADPH-dependent reductase [Eubacterium sp.]
MKITTVMGSPKKHGKTATALEFFEKQLLSQGHEIDRINITDYHINGCLGCYACMQNKDVAGCVQKDEMLWSMHPLCIALTLLLR